MDIRDTIKRLENRELSRRELSQAMAAVGLVSTVMPLTAAQAQEEQAIYFTWAGYDDPIYWPGYVEQHGVEPDCPVYGDAEEAFTKVRAGFVVDLIHPCSNNVPRWRHAGVLQPIDTSMIPNWKDVIPALYNIKDAQHEGQQWFAPFEWGQTSITYRTDIVDWQGEEESWGLLWDERYAGRLSIIDAAEDAWWCAAIYAGVDTDNLTDEALAEVLDILRQQRDLLRFRQSDMTTVEQALASGELVAAMTWNSSPLELTRQGIPVRFADVKEGALTWVCGTVLTSDAPHYDKAHDLINAMLAPEVGEYVIVENGYGHASTAAFDLVSDDDLTARGLSRTPSDILDKGVFLRAQTEDIETKINRDWGEMIAGF